MSAIAFAPSIAILSLVQASLIALPSRPDLPSALRLSSRWWALILPGSIIVVIAGIAIFPDLADALTYLALVGVPILAALALAWAIRGARPGLALLPVPLFATAWAAPGALTGQAAALALSALACVALGTLLAASVPAGWLRLAIYAMAIVDTCLVTADLLQSPNAVLNAAAPAAGLPQLQFAHLGSAVLGFGDLFVAAVLGAILAGDRVLQVRASGLAACFALAFDLLFFLVSILPATVPIAVTLAALDMWARRRPFSDPASRPLAPGGPRDAAA
ncbi:MAG TPA: hypothetical protein VLB79_04195 [Solirubrobacterales bacterium]|nr:hypothetical protein [Solirubrobacterales bacterium]